jgi:phage terminase large subunit-like protein
LTPEELALAMEALNDEALDYVAKDWILDARDDQLAPGGSWRIWLFLGGRGAGKTRAGAEWIAQGVSERSMQRIGLIGATFNDARAVMIEGVSGLKAASPAAEFAPSLHRVTWPSGAQATVLSADEPDGIRGHQFDAIWADEFAKWENPQAALDMALMSLRIGAHPRLALTTTPRNIAPLWDLLTSSDVVVTRARTADNRANLAPGFLETMKRRYAGSRLGRQELDAEIIEDNDAALWRRAWIDDTRVRTAPELARIVVAVDPPAGAGGDACGIVVAGRVENDGDAYILADLSSDGLTPGQWSARVADAFAQYEADLVIAEANQGGDMVRAVLTEQLPHLPLTLVHATRAKKSRALPIAALYEQGRVHHVGALAELEDQMCQYDGTGKSPDRMDALVWALSHLFPMTPRAKPKVRSI